FCRYSFIGSGSIWPDPDAEVWIFTVSFLLGPNPASCISFCAAALSYLISKLGLPRQGWPGSKVPVAGTIRPASRPSLRPSRSTQRLAALRTRMSFQGEPSTRENCQGQTCGSSLLLIVKPRCLISATASGAGASTQSTLPESSAAVRAFASGIGSSTIFSTLGTRALSQ